MIDRNATRIGIVGVGLMGLGIATNVLSHGWKLSFLDHPGNQPTSGLTEAGAQACATCAALAEASDVIILCVTDSRQVEEVVLGDGGLLSALQPGTTILDCSTALPHSTRMVADKVIAKGGQFLDCPMTRTPKEAMAGKLNLIIGGDEALLDDFRPLLDCFAENITHVGAIGDGHAMKLLHNYVSLGFTTVLAEAAAAAKRGGIDAKRFIEVLQNGAGSGVVLDRLAPYIMEGDPSGLQFSISNAAKDMTYYVEMAETLETERRTAQSSLESLRAAVNAGEGDKFLPELIARFAERTEPGNNA